MTSSSSKGQFGEFDLIAKFFAPLATHPGAVGLKDDVATLPPRAGHELVLKTDAIVEGVHFLKDDPPDTIGRKALRVNLSDLAAKGAEPAGYLLSLSLNAQTPASWVEAFARGLGEDQKLFAISLLGGDTTATPGPTTICVTALGWTPEGRTPRRSGAKLRDLVFVTGTIGDAAAGLTLLKSGAVKSSDDPLVLRYRLPQPRLAFGKALREFASATLDVSDGLIADLGHIAETSRARILVSANRIPLSPTVSALWGADAAMRAATAGDDYEIAFTVSPENHARVLEAAQQTATAVTQIGRVEVGQGVALLDAQGGEIPVTRGGYTHF